VRVCSTHRRKVPFFHHANARSESARRTLLRALESLRALCERFGRWSCLLQIASVRRGGRSTSLV
jgi:hypothetical protein